MSALQNVYQRPHHVGGARYREQLHQPLSSGRPRDLLSPQHEGESHEANSKNARDQDIQNTHPSQRPRRVRQRPVRGVDKALLSQQLAYVDDSKHGKLQPKEEHAALAALALQGSGQRTRGTYVSLEFAITGSVASGSAAGAARPSGGRLLHVSEIRQLPARAEGEAPKFILLRDGQVRIPLPRCR